MKNIMPVACGLTVSATICTVSTGAQCLVPAVSVTCPLMHPAAHKHMSIVTAQNTPSKKLCDNEP